MYKVYSTNACKWCKVAKEYFEQNGIQYKEVDVGKDLEARKEMVYLTGQMGVPVISNGTDFIIGWDIDKFNKLNEENTTKKEV